MRYRKRYYIKKCIFAVITVCIIGIIAETSARLLEESFRTDDKPVLLSPGWQTTFFSSIFSWHIPSPQLLWRFKPNLNNKLIHTNSRGFIGDEVTIEKPAHTFRIMLLGDSSPVGIGLQNRTQAFGDILKRRLSLLAPDSINIELINASVSGYSSEQIACFMDMEGWAYQPDLLILYCGNNDASISGMYSDQELLHRQKMRSIRLLLSHSAFYRIMRSLLLKICQLHELPPPSTLQVRVSPERFAHNLRHIVTECKQHDCHIIILEPPVPYLWPAGLQFKVFTHVTGKDGKFILPDELRTILEREIAYCLHKDQSRSNKDDFFTNAVYHAVFRDTLPTQEALIYWNGQSTSYPDNPVVLNNLAVALWRNGQYKKADSLFRTARKYYIQQHQDSMTIAYIAAGSPFLYNIGINMLSAAKSKQPPDDTSLAYLYLDSAKEADYFSLRIKNAYIRKINMLRNEETVTIIDLPMIFRQHGGDKLFIDHCHPTPEGHIIIAEQLLQVIQHRFCFHKQDNVFTKQNHFE